MRRTRVSDSRKKIPHVCVFRFLRVRHHNKAQPVHIFGGSARSRSFSRHHASRRSRRAITSRRTTHARATRARAPESPGLGGGGVARCTAPGTANAPSAAATDTAVPEATPFHGVPLNPFRAPDKTPPLPSPSPTTAGVTGGVRRTCPTAVGSTRASIRCVDGAKNAGLLASSACRIRRNTSRRSFAREFSRSAPIRADPANAR